jgi:sulfur-oxidizing protein SoxY
MPVFRGPTRRAVLAGASASVATLAISSVRAEEAGMQRAILAFTGGVEPKAGRIKLEVAPLVENGNSVSLALEADSPMTQADHVTELALFTEKNPLPEVAVFHLGPRAGIARVETRIRVATTQHLVAVARMSDGGFWQDRREVIITIAACTEE